MKKVLAVLTAVLSIFIISACNNTSSGSLPLPDNNNKEALERILSESLSINELYYEEVPQNILFSGGLRTENSTRVWMKGNVLKTEHVTNFYKDDELVYSETAGELFNYDSFSKIHYYSGPYPEQAKLYYNRQEDSLSIPRNQTILWYLDKITPDINSIQEIIQEEDHCLLVEILKNNFGSTEVWISLESGLPKKIVTKYNNNSSVREYHNFHIGSGSVAEDVLAIPPMAIII